MVGGDKTLLSFCLSVMLAFGFAACSDDDDGGNSNSNNNGNNASSNAKTELVSVTGATVSGAVSGSDVFIAGRTVTIPNLLVSDHEVTQGEYETYCKYGSDSPSESCGKGTNYPAYNVS